MKALKKWALKKAVEWFPKELVVSFALNRLLDRSNTRDKALMALKVARRIAEAAKAAIIALESLLSADINTKALGVLQESAEKLAIKAWSNGNVTPPESRHLKERKDVST